MLSKYTSMPSGVAALKSSRNVGGPVVDGGVEAELVDEHPALVVDAGDADDPAAREAGDLADEVTDRPGRRRDDHRLARLRLADVEQAEVGGQTVGAEHGEVQCRDRSGVE